VVAISGVAGDGTGEEGSDGETEAGVEVSIKLWRLLVGLFCWQSTLGKNLSIICAIR
jgi:hypothetical protein